MAAANVLVEDLETLALAPDDAHHLKSVLRLRPGEPVGATDGRGGYVPCVWRGGASSSASSSASSAWLEAVGPAQRAAPRQPSLCVGFVPVKGDRPEWAVQKLTELGVDRIMVLSSERSVVRWQGERLRSHLDRLDRVARSAVMQSRQLWLPAISGGVTVADLLADPSPAVALADMGGRPLAAGLHTILVGPEGGWTPAERGRAGGRVVGLGATVLRGETAARGRGGAADRGALRPGRPRLVAVRPPVAPGPGSLPVPPRSLRLGPFPAPEMAGSQASGSARSAVGPPVQPVQVGSQALFLEPGPPTARRTEP